MVSHRPDDFYPRPIPADEPEHVSHVLDELLSPADLCRRLDLTPFQVRTLILADPGRLRHPAGRPRISLLAFAALLGFLAYFDMMARTEITDPSRWRGPGLGMVSDGAEGFGPSQCSKECGSERNLRDRA
jgi:hypothetical protein